MKNQSCSKRALIAKMGLVPKTGIMVVALTSFLTLNSGLTVTSAQAQILEQAQIQTQSISVGTLGSASAYDGGILDVGDGGFEASLWQGTSAQLAKQLIETAPLENRQAVIRDLVRAALLSAGVPPVFETSDQKDAYDKARIQAVAKMGDIANLTALTERMPETVNRSPDIKVEIALLNGDTQTACSVTDTVTEGRATPLWARLRAYCHVLREEIPAAELTTDLLAQSDYEDKTFFALMNVLLGAVKPEDVSQKLVFDEALDLTLADLADIRSGQGPLAPYLAVRRTIDLDRSDIERIEALYQGSPFMTDTQISNVLQGFASSESSLAGANGLQGVVSGDVPETYDLDTVLSLDTPKALGHIYSLALSADTPEVKAKAIVEFLNRASAVGKFDRFAVLMQGEAQLIPMNIQALIGLKTFAQLAINRNDIGTLQGLYRALEEGSVQQSRIALVSDALGNGFFGGDLGRDIEARLSDFENLSKPRQERAVRDSYIALAMGASLQAKSSKRLTNTGRGDGQAISAGAILALESAARRGARAETALRSATVLSTFPLTDLDAKSLAAIITALRVAGLDNYAGRLAAEDFLSGL